MADQELTAVARVATSTPGRYIKQLASHLGRKSEVRVEGDVTEIVLSVGSCVLTADGEVLDMRARAADEDGLETVMRVIGKHLERFGQRNELDVQWSRPGE